MILCRKLERFKRKRMLLKVGFTFGEKNVKIDLFLAKIAMASK